MAVRIIFPNGETRIIREAVKVDAQNFHEGTVDFYDEKGNLLEQISMNEQFMWEIAGEPTDDFEIDAKADKAIKK